MILITVLLSAARTSRLNKVYSNHQKTHQNTVSKVLSSQDKFLFPLLVAAEDACQVVPTQIIPNLAIHMMMNELLQWSQVCK